MSLLRPVLNLWLKWTERPMLARAQDPQRVRASFERKARLFFHPPWGAKRQARQIAGRSALEVTCGPSEAGTLLYFHGGAYVFGSPRTHWAMLARLCQSAPVRAILPDYRKAPEHLHPAAIEDAHAAYKALLAEGHAPNRVILGGDSAGGGLALALLGQLCAEGGPLPAGCFAFSPLTDLTHSGASVQQNAARDVILPASRVRDMSEMFLGPQDPTDPRASPLFAAFKGAPPVWITVSDTEILRDDSRRIVEHLRAAGAEVSFTETHDLPHVWPIFQPILPEAQQTLRALGTWITQRLPTPSEN